MLLPKKDRDRSPHQSTGGSLRREFCLGLAFVLLSVVVVFQFFSLQRVQRSHQRSLDSYLQHRERHHGGLPDGRLVVITPFHGGDVDDLKESLSVGWYHRCRHNEAAKRNIDLVLYYAGGEDKHSLGAWETVLPALTGRCFRNVKLAFAWLTDEENVYPMGPTLMFYKMFVDERVSAQFAEYDVAALVEWDVTILDNNAFDTLWDTAFTHEQFWVKGATLKGATFHETAKVPAYQSILGHINGNGLYNLNSVEFKEYVKFTMTRYPPHLVSYDVALWQVMNDFPYSWLMWQRFISKFKHVDMIMNAGVDLDPQDLMQQWLRKDPGMPQLIHVRMSDDKRFQPFMEGYGIHEYHPARDAVCSEKDVHIKHTKYVYDHTCVVGIKQRWSGHNCSGSCRLCYEDLDAARAAERKLYTTQSKHESGVHEDLGSCGMRPHVMMCNTRRPPSSANCSLQCISKKESVCDYRCIAQSDSYDVHGCGFRNYGRTCRYCFTDPHIARSAGGDRFTQNVIMCDTLEPPLTEDCEEQLGKIASPTYESDLVKSDEEEMQIARQEPKAGEFLGARNASIEDMHVARKLGEKNRVDVKLNTTSLDAPVSANVCIFLRSDMSTISILSRALQSIGQHWAGSHVVIVTPLADRRTLETNLQKMVGNRNTLTVAPVQDVRLSALYADKLCGEGTDYIFYMQAGAVLSRTVLGKDIFDAKGRLLVQWQDPKHYADHAIVDDWIRGASHLLGWTSPIFTWSQDTVLPASVNRDLRRFLKSRWGWQRNELYLIVWQVPKVNMIELLCSFAYGRPPVSSLEKKSVGVRFYNPESWTKQHVLLTEVSVWDVPILKPLYTSYVS